MNLFHAPRDVRNRLLLIVLLALAFALGAATLGFNVLFAHTTSRDASALLRESVDSELALIRVDRKWRIRIAERGRDELADSQIWIFGGHVPIEAPAARPETAAAAASLIGKPSRYVDVSKTDERLYSVPIRRRGRRVGTLVAGTNLAPYEQTRRTALATSLLFALTLLGIVGVAVWWLLRSALRPVAQMTAQAAAWSEHDLDRRFALGEPHDELTRLAATLDGLLDRIAASLRHERRFSVELSHELRTPLAKLIAEAELALRRERAPREYRETLAVILRNANQLTRIVETLLAAAQQEAGVQGVADAASVARAAAQSCSRLAEERGIEVAVEEPGVPLRVGVDVELAERILHPVVENACLYGNTQVRMSLTRAQGAVLFTIDDDGPGVAEAEREAIFEPATRGTAGREGGAGAGLGLSLARRLARSSSGEIDAPPSANGGRFVVRLPSA